ncbi:hypothetical protein V1517DRAFT_157428 [Lipomyces orientalis]|uniref:Uncharacterized protein n=1 Tax=Lipomyces orientalis TaxID=1233043 RepID=A0ACC3TMM6_9ASCO
MTSTPSNLSRLSVEPLEIVNIHSYILPSYNLRPFREFECRNDKWRAVIEKVCEGRTSQHQSQALEWPPEQYDGPTERTAATASQQHLQPQNQFDMAYDEILQISLASSEVDEDEADDDEPDDYDEQDTPVVIEQQLNNIVAGGVDSCALAAYEPTTDSTINIGLLPVNHPNTMITAAAPGELTLGPSTNKVSSTSLRAPISTPTPTPRPILSAPFDANPYISTITVAEWQEFLSRPSTVQIWRRKARLGDIANDTSETASASIAAKRRKRYEWTHVYVCAHAGAPRDRRDPNKRRRKTNKKSIKCGCKARITAAKIIDQDSVVVRWSWQHNGHEYEYPGGSVNRTKSSSEGTTKTGNVQDVGKEVQSLVESIGSLWHMDAKANGNDRKRLVLWRNILASTLSKGVEIFVN